MKRTESEEEDWKWLRGGGQRTSRLEGMKEDVKGKEEDSPVSAEETEETE